MDVENPILVHMTDSGELPKETSLSSKAVKGRVRIRDLKAAGTSSAASSIVASLSNESLSSKYKKNNKPSRRWLALEVEKLFKANIQLATQVKEKQAREEELTIVKRRLQSELAVLKGSTNTVEMDTLKKKNKELSQDVFMLKSLVVKLTAELGRSQEKIRSYRKSLEDKHDECISEDSGLADLKGERMDLMSGELGALWPLLKAYEETITEKKSLVTTLRQQLEQLADQMKAIVDENTVLHKRLSSNLTEGEISQEDYLQQQRELARSEEQNKLLVRQAKLNQAQLLELRTTFQTNLSECCMGRDSALEELQQCRAELFMLKGRFSVLQEEYRAAREEADSKVPQSVHNASINECKRLFDELKTKYEEERDSLMRKLASLEAGRPDLEIRLSTLSAERDRLMGQIDSMQLTAKKLESRCIEMEEKLSRAEKAKENLKLQLSTAVAFSGELIREQERLVKQLMMRAEEAKLGSGLSKRLHALKIQVKGVEMEAVEQMNLLDDNLRSQADYVGKIRENYVREIQKLREEITEKEAAIVKLSDENKRAQEEINMNFIWNPTPNKPEDG